MIQADSLRDQMLKSYIDQIFNKYDADNNGTLDTQEMTNFFNDLFRSLNIQLTVTEQQSQEAIRSIDTNFDGKVDRKELFEAFKVMLNCSNSPQPPPQQNMYVRLNNRQNPNPYAPNQYQNQPGYNAYYGQNNYSTILTI